MKIPFRFLLLPTALMVLAATAHASDTGSDNASNYGGTWSSGDNKGSGFNPWALTSNASNNSTSGYGGFFIGDSTTLNGNNTGANINTGGMSFGMYANQNADVYANADRSFAGGALTGGQAFSLDLGVNYRNGAKGINLRDVGGNVIFTFNVTGDNYKVTDATTTGGSFGDYSSNSAFHLAFSQTDSAGGTWTITRSGGITSTVTGTYGGDASSFRLFIGNTDGGNENNLFANNLAITGVPEPATWLGGAFAAVAAGWRLRRSRTRRVLAAA